ncbi:hypothetical protein PGT21_005140 [Puccinia graminis f. sp. tritici]|uniref:Uncharacterized protein n=2 Tax=Puccinia graminis f. sp. tritici TaxID=56615 RepID=A0A5B0PTA0_PUCGR|nr:hypothetical protein PGTUg99_023276 [Puccinia graminis f. sp. tritici]KAA1103943.1 hypothetical protein PGT21_005140 [Puccinia graminis f. sp. tritici]
MTFRLPLHFSRSIALLVAYFVLISTPVRLQTTSYKGTGLSPLRSINLSYNLILTSIMSPYASAKPESASGNPQSHEPLSSSSNDQAHEPLLITNAPADSPSQETQGQSIAVGSEGVQLDHLGPMVINSDGTISRISNWDKLTEPEKSRTIRLVTQRNALRVQKLKDIPPKTDEQPPSSNEDPNQPAHSEL